VTKKTLTLDKQVFLPKKRVTVSDDLTPEQANIGIAAGDTTSYLDIKIVAWRINATCCCRVEDFFSGILVNPPRRTAETRHFLSRGILFHAVSN
jgi:hypothetical protein